MMTLCPVHDRGVGDTEDAFEAEAKVVLQRLLGGVVVDRDVPGAQGVRDFDLVDAGGQVTHAIEVTSVQLGSARATRAALERLNTRDLGLTASWHLYVHEEAPIRPIERNAPTHLNLLDANGLTDFSDLDPPGDPQLARAVNALAAMHVPRGFRLDETPFRLSAGGFGSGSLDPMNLTRAVEASAAETDNRRKLAAAPNGAERHLIVWLHDSNWYVSSLLRDPIAPPPRPLLPDEVDVVWIAVGDGPGTLTCTALLRGDRQELVEIDVDSGARLPRRSRPGAVSGPPDTAPTCVVCGGPGRWEERVVEQTAPNSDQAEQVLIWQATCKQDPDHWAMPGRMLSAAELAERQP